MITVFEDKDVASKALAILNKTNKKVLHDLKAFREAKRTYQNLFSQEWRLEITSLESSIALLEYGNDLLTRAQIHLLAELKKI